MHPLLDAAERMLDDFATTVENFRSLLGARPCDRARPRFRSGKRSAPRSLELPPFYRTLGYGD